MTETIERCPATRGDRRCQRAERHSSKHRHRCNRSTHEWNDQGRAYVVEAGREPDEPIRPCTCSVRELGE